MNQHWGIDLGGTKIEGVVLNKDLEVLVRKRIATESDQGYEHVVGRIIKLIDILSAETGSKAQNIGIGTPGVLDPITNKMKNCNSTALNGQFLKKDLEKRLGLEIKMANDANCFAVAETCLGIVKDELPKANVVFGVIMGTGVGGGLVIDGKAIYGKHGIAGEWGHNYLDDSGGDCYCGRTGCVETIISGPALERFYKKKAGETKKLKDILNSLEVDPIAQQTKERLIHFFGKSIASIINIIDPDAIVLGGGLGNIDCLYDEGIKEVEKHVFNHSMDTLFLKPKLGDSAGVFGAALL